MTKVINGIYCVCKYGLEIPMYELESAYANNKRFLYAFRSSYLVSVKKGKLDFFFVGRLDKGKTPHTKRGRYVFMGPGVK